MTKESKLKHKEQFSMLDHQIHLNQFQEHLSLTCYKLHTKVCKMCAWGIARNCNTELSTMKPMITSNFQRDGRLKFLQLKFDCSVCSHKEYLTMSIWNLQQSAALQHWNVHPLNSSQHPPKISKHLVGHENPSCQ